MIDYTTRIIIEILLIIISSSFAYFQGYWKGREVQAKKHQLPEEGTTTTVRYP